jgi:hypothetical protein
VLGVAVQACTAKRDSAAAGSDTNAREAKPTTAIQGGSVPDAEARLAAFLESALEFNARQDFESLMACVPDGQTDRYAALARYRVLGSSQRGDTVNTSAEIVTVAEETGDPHVAGGYVTTVRTRTDTLHWAMKADSSSGKWGVCGYSREGLSFGHYGSDRDTRWTPRGFSWARVKQIAESVHASP